MLRDELILRDSQSTAAKTVDAFLVAVVVQGHPELGKLDFSILKCMHVILSGSIGLASLTNCLTMLLTSWHRTPGLQPRCVACIVVAPRLRLPDSL